MLRVQMGSDHCFVFSLQEPFCQLHADPVGQLWGDFPFGKALHQMEALHPVHLVVSFLCSYHILIGSLTDTADGILKNGTLRLVPVHGVINGFFQRAGTLPFFCGLILVSDVRDGIVQTADRDDTGVCHRLPFLFDQPPCFFRHAEHFPDTLFPGHPTAVSYMGKLIGVVAQTGYFPQKLRMMLTGSCPDFAAHDKGTDIFLTGQAAFLYLLFQKTQLLRIEADWYHMVSFSHLFTCFPTGYWLLLHYISRFFQIRKPARTPMATAAAMIFFFIWASPPFRYLAQHHRGEHDPSLFHLFCKFQKVPFLPIDHSRIGIQIVAGGYVPLSIWGILHKALPVCQTEQFLSLAVYKTDAHAVVDDLLPFHPAPLQCLILTLSSYEKTHCKNSHYSSGHCAKYKSQHFFVLLSSVYGSVWGIGVLPKVRLDIQTLCLQNQSHFASSPLNLLFL